MSLHDGIEGFKQSMARRPVSDNTRKAFVGDLLIFERWVGGPCSLASIREDQLQAFLRHLESSLHARSPKSVERRLTSLKVFFDWLTKAGAMAVNPADKIAYRPFADALPEYLTEAQAEQVVLAAGALAAGEKIEVRPLIAINLVLETGIKKGECMALTIETVLWREASPNIQIRYAQKHLQYKNRVLSISSRTATVIGDYVERFGVRDRLLDCTGRNLEYLFNRKVANAAGIESLTFEQLRWTCALREFRPGSFTDVQLQHRYGLSAPAWAEMEHKLRRIMGAGN